MSSYSAVKLKREKDMHASPPYYKTKTKNHKIKNKKKNETMNFTKYVIFIFILVITSLAINIKQIEFEI